MGLFEATHQWEGGQKGPLPKICHTYPTMMKPDTVIPYLKKIQKIYKSRDTSLISLKVVLISIVAILMMSAKLATLDFLKIKLF